MLVDFFSDSNGSVPISSSGRYELHRWDGSDFIYVTEFGYSSFTATIPAPDAGWYALTLRIDTGGPYVKCTINQGTGGSVGCIAHRPIPGIMDRTTLTGIRVNGASVMITPDSAELSKGGLCVGNQLPNAYQVEGFLQNVSGGKGTDTLLTLKGSTQMDFGKGIYGWHRSYSESSYELQTPFRYNIDYTVQSPDGAAAVKSVSNYVSYMDPPDGWVVVACTTPLNVTGGSVTYPGGIMHATWAWSVEYMTNDVWVGASLPRLGASEYDEVMARIASCPQFMENSFHIRDLSSWLRDNFNTAGRDVNRFIKAFGPDMKTALASILKGLEYISNKAANY
jgi:hypothetical protein